MGMVSVVERVICYSRHMFVYCEKNDIEIIKDVSSKYIACVDTDLPIAVYIKDNGLPKSLNVLDLDKDRLSSFHRNYFDFVISLSIIDTLINQIDKDILNHRLDKLFKRYSKIYKNSNINSIDDFREKLLIGKETYYNKYVDYLNNNLTDFFDQLPIPFIMLDMFLPDLKEMLGIDSYFSILFDFTDGLSVFNQKTVNSYIGSRCNKDFSINVFCNDSEWKVYVDLNNMFVEYIHDYGIIDMNEYKCLVKSRHI